MMRLLALLMVFLTTLKAEHPLVIGVAGGTGSGKTTLARKIQEAFPGQSILISQDSYYKNLSGLPIQKREKMNFDHPDSLDFDLLVQQVKNLREGITIEKPIYNFHNHNREPFTETVAPNKIIILEGILLFAVPDV